jgi:GNAT superfamily N-acetyltransferase
MAGVVGPVVFRRLFGDDWRRYQEDDVRRACSAYPVVDLSCQRRGVGSALTAFAIEQMRAAGQRLAIVNTGGDAGHAAARATYERAGFRSLPSEQYFLAIDARD